VYFWKYTNTAGNHGAFFKRCIGNQETACTFADITNLWYSIGCVNTRYYHCILIMCIGLCSIRFYHPLSVKFIGLPKVWTINCTIIHPF